MKKTLAFLLSILLAAGLLLSFAACGGRLSGEYVNDKTSGTPKSGAVTTYDFSGNEVTLTIAVYIAGKETVTRYSGAYEITEGEDGALSISFDLVDANGEKAKAQSVTAAYVEAFDGSYIKIGEATYTKK